MDKNPKLNSGTGSSKKTALRKARNLDQPERLAQTGLGGEPCVSSGALPSNTAPANCRNPIPSDSSDTHIGTVLHTGIDSLYLSFHGQTFTEFEDKLEKYKALASSTKPQCQAEAVIHLDSLEFMVMPKGKGNFPYVIKNNWFHISISKSSSKSMPMAYVQISNELLTKGDLQKIILSLDYLVSLIGKVNSQPTVSRVDLKVDFITSLLLHHISRKAWICRAKDFHQYFQGNHFSGYVFGAGGDISCRIYNKTLEIKKSKKTYFFPIWENNGWDLTSDVWRIEFQIKRSILSELRIRTLDDLLSKIPPLWHYCTEKWLKLTVPVTADKTQSRWPIHPLWSLLTHTNWLNCNSNSEPLSRIRHSNIPSDEYLYKNGISAITSLMAKDGIDSFKDASTKFIKNAQLYHLEHFNVNQKTIETYARDKAKEKARKYHTKHKFTEGQDHEDS